MSDETEIKLVTCTVNGCDMDFTNKEHLNWHQKKHDIVLNLELINKNSESADQTPTPTRFIRNCEEVGLFQDLQHVNPFDETFKKAVDSVKNGGSLEAPEENNSNDTLHTPHILPHIEENQKKIVILNSKQVTSHSYDFTTNELQTIFMSKHPAVKDDKLIKKQIIEHIKKNKLRCKEGTNSFISCVPFGDLTRKKKYIINVESEEGSESSCNEKKKQIREMNRAAQVRCRKRKQHRWKLMETEINNLKEENKKLKSENVFIKKQLMHYLEKNSATKETDASVSTTNSQQKVEETSQNCGNQKCLSPMIFQFIPSDTSVSIPYIQSQSSGGPKSLKLSSEEKVITNEDGNLKTKQFRKIIPKIIIDK